MFFLLQTKNDKLHRIRISRCDCPTMEPFFLFFRGIPKFDILSVLSNTEFHIQFMEILRGFKTWHHHVWTHRKMSKFFGEIDHFKTPMDLHIDASITSIAFGMFTRGYPVVQNADNLRLHPMGIRWRHWPPVFFYPVVMLPIPRLTSRDSW